MPINRGRAGPRILAQAFAYATQLLGLAQGEWGSKPRRVFGHYAVRVGGLSCLDNPKTGRGWHVYLSVHYSDAKDAPYEFQRKP